MNEMCGDNRFEIIARAKKHLLDATNIDTSADEMKVLDDFLYRCWQMGWLDRYDTADTPQTDCNPTCEFYDEQCLNVECYGCCDGYSHYKPKDEPQLVKESPSLVKDLVKDTPQTESHITCYGICTDKCGAYENGDCTLNARKADTPQTERIKTPDYCDICNHKGCDNCIANSLDDYCVPSGYEPITQTETQNSNLTFDTPQTESTGSPIGDYRDGVGAWQTERMTEEEIDTMLAKALVGQTDCGWGKPTTVGITDKEV